MPIADFTDLYTSLCELMHAPPSRLERGENNLLGFSVEADGVTVGFMEAEADGNPGALMVVEFGAADAPREVEVLRELLDSNFLLFDINAPSFGRNPHTGVLSLHQYWLLAHAQVQDIYHDMTRAIQAAAQWKDRIVDDARVSTFER